MSDEQTQADPHTTLSPSQAARVDFARRDLESARAADLTQLPPAGLILVVERLRTRLDDMLTLVNETTKPQPEVPE